MLAARRLDLPSRWRFAYNHSARQGGGLQAAAQDKTEPAQRSFFLFGPQAMYSLDQIQALVGPTVNPLILRQFVGSAEFGWKVAWSDRMVAMYTGLLLFGLLYWPLRHRARPLVWWGFGLLILPMLADGLTHMISDFAGVGRGFRDSNAWLAA